jgi:nicotinamidase-related amidase
VPVDPARAPLADAPAARGTALLIVDMISSWDFPDSDKLAPRAVAIAPRIGALKQRCAHSGVPAISVNDNRERWRSEFREIARLAAEASAAGAAIARSLAPGDDDYAVLKPKHSVFFATPLDLLLRHLRATHLIITGVASDQCILVSAAEAHMRDYEVIVPGDCVAALSAARNARALRTLEEAHRVKTTVSPHVRLPRRRARRPD